MPKMNRARSLRITNGISARVIIHYLALFAFCLLLVMSFFQGVEASRNRGKYKNENMDTGATFENDEYGNRGPGVGNIGCLFSKSVCDEKVEWCFDDYAFGRCLPSQGVVDERSLYRYTLSKSDSHALEKEMERLFALGYRWRHSYTQCVLQNLLESQRQGSEWEQAVCSEEVDQDLEGALKAFAEDIDPLNLAFVKFTPSKINPHANFADEMYRPPDVEAKLRETVRGRPELNSQMLKQQILELNPPEEKLLGEALEDYLTEDLPPFLSSIPSWKSKKSASPMTYRAGAGSGKRTAFTDDDWKREVEQEAVNEALFDQQYGRGSLSEDFGVGPGGIVDDGILQPRIFSSLYNTPDSFRSGVELKDELIPMKGFGDGDVRSIEGMKSRTDDNDMEQEQEELQMLEQLASLAKYQALLQRQQPAAGDIDIESELQLGLPSRQAFRSDLRDSPVVDEERSARVPEFLPVPAAALGSLPASADTSEPHYTEGGLVFLNNDESPELIFSDDNLVSSSGPTNSRKKDAFLKRFFVDVEDDDDSRNERQLKDEDQSRNGAFELTYGYGFGGESPYGPQRAFERRERLDVKKPGPWYRTVNNFAFDTHKDNMEKDKSVNNNVLSNPEFSGGEGPADMMTLPQQSKDPQLESYLQSQKFSNDNSRDTSTNNEQEDNNQLNNELQLNKVKDITSKFGGFIDKKSAPSNFKDTNSGANDEHLGVVDTSYVYVDVGETITFDDARSFVKEIANLLGIDQSSFTDIRVSDRGNIITFKATPDAKQMNASQIVKQIENREIKGVKITKAGVGITPNSKVPVMYEESIASNSLFITTFALCGFVAAILVAAVSLFLIRKHAKSRQKIARLSDEDPSFEACKEYQDLCRARYGSKNNEKVEPLKGATQRVASTMSRDSENGTNSSRSSTSSWTEEPVLTNMDISTGHMVLSYMEDHLKKRDRLDQEWAGLCNYEADPCSTAIAEKPEHNKKNRYSNSLPYDHSRVILNDLANINGSDYINASTITDHDPRNPAYIATQGPLVNTAADFWQMVWEQGSVVIVTLTRLNDNGTALCHRYWPEEGSELHHIYEVHLVSEHIWCDEYLVRSFYLKNLKTGETRTVTQFHFQAWPENSIPQSTKAILEFRRKVNKSYRGRSCPIIVHCSDGAGRSGTYCLIDMVLNRMAKGAKEIDIAASLEHIRDQRPGMVRTKQQFEFVLMAVAEEVHAILKALPQ